MLFLVFSIIIYWDHYTLYAASSRYSCSLSAGLQKVQDCINWGIATKRSQIYLTGKITLKHNQTININSGTSNNITTIDSQYSEIKKMLSGAKGSNTMMIRIAGKGQLKLNKFNLYGGTDSNQQYLTAIESAHGLSVTERSSVWLGSSFITGVGGDAFSVKDQAFGSVNKSFLSGRRWGAVSINNGSSYPKDSNDSTPMLAVSESELSGGLCSIGGEREENSNEGLVHSSKNKIKSNLPNKYSGYPSYRCLFKNPEVKGSYHGFKIIESNNTFTRRYR